MYWYAQLCEKVNALTLQKCWNKLFNGLHCQDDENEDYKNIQSLLENLSGFEHISNEEIREWLNSDDSEIDFSQQDIVNMVLQSEQNKSDADAEDNDIVECS